MHKWIILLIFILAACESEPPSIQFADLSAGDAGSGEKIFQQSNNDAPSCTSCHAMDGTQLIGPSLVGIGERAGERVNGQGAAEYIFNSIVRPAIYLVPGYSNLMYTQYAEELHPDDIADIIAYLLQQ